MAGEIQILIPVTFNPLKHHRNTILKFLEKATLEEMKELSDSICSNYIDVYTGELTPELICNAVIDTLKSNRIFQEENFNRWILETKGYRQLKLNDQSEWIIRKGNEPGRYIHIHPSKTGPFTLRFKGSTLKTVYRLKMEYPLKKHLSLENINRARIDIALSPIKKPEPGKGIVKCWEVFFAGQ